MVRERGWGDIGNFICQLMLVSAIDYGGALSKKLDACVRQGEEPRNTYGWRDVVSAMLSKPAEKTSAIREKMTHKYGPLLSVLGLFGGVGGGYLAGTGVFGLIGINSGTAALASLAAGVVAAPLIAATIGVGCSIVLPMLGAAALYWPTMLSSGFREAGICRQYRENPPKVLAAQVAKNPPITGALEAHLRLIGLQEAHARESFFRSLRKRFPAEFNEAANLDAHAPVLRAPVAVKGPLKFRKPAEEQGAAP